MLTCRAHHCPERCQGYGCPAKAPHDLHHWCFFHVNINMLLLCMSVSGDCMPPRRRCCCCGHVANHAGWLHVRCAFRAMQWAHVGTFCWDEGGCSCTPTCTTCATATSCKAFAGLQGWHMGREGGGLEGTGKCTAWCVDAAAMRVRVGACMRLMATSIDTHLASRYSFDHDACGVLIPSGLQREHTSTSMPGACLSSSYALHCSSS